MSPATVRCKRCQAGTTSTAVHPTTTTTPTAATTLGAPSATQWPLALKLNLRAELGAGLRLMGSVVRQAEMLEVTAAVVAAATTAAGATLQPRRGQTLLFHVRHVTAQGRGAASAMGEVAKAAAKWHPPRQAPPPQGRTRPPTKCLPRQLPLRFSVAHPLRGPAQLPVPPAPAARRAARQLLTSTVPRLLEPRAWEMASAPTLAPQARPAVVWSRALCNIGTLDGAPVAWLPHIRQAAAASSSSSSSSSTQVKMLHVNLAPS